MASPFPDFAACVEHIGSPHDDIARARHDGLGAITVELREHPQQLKVSQTYAWRFRNEVFVR